MNDRYTTTSLQQDRRHAQRRTATPTVTSASLASAHHTYTVADSHSRVSGRVRDGQDDEGGQMNAADDDEDVPCAVQASEAQDQAARSLGQHREHHQHTRQDDESVSCTQTSPGQKEAHTKFLQSWDMWSQLGAMAATQPVS
jgi:hypothetical protein